MNITYMPKYYVIFCGATMPTCCIVNCKNYTSGYKGTRNIKYFTFPKDIAVRQQWLNACRKKETDMKVNAARICSIHFKENCFTLEKTKSRKPELAKEILRLKKGSIPTELLNLEKKRKGVMSQSTENSKKVKVSVKSFLSTYSELVQYARQKQQEEIVTNVEIPNMIAQNTEKQNAVQEMYDVKISKDSNVSVETNVETPNAQNTEEQNTVQEIMPEISKNSNVSVEMLLKQLTKLEEQNQKLLDKNIILEEKNQNLNIQVTQLQADVKQLTKNRDKEAKRLTIDTLRKVFTPGQITMLMTPTKNHVKWSAEDIMSAISLRSLSPKAYRFLRDVKKIPLPCASTLRNWIN